MKICQFLFAVLMLVAGMQPASADVSLKVKVLLEGAYDASSGLMRDDLRSKDLLPLDQPYNYPPFNHAGAETVSPGILAREGETAMVDWMLVELLNASGDATPLASRAVILQRNGWLAEPQTGATSLLFAGLAPGSYRVAIRHRNHLGVTSLPVNLGQAASLMDFTSVLEGDASRYMAYGKAMLWAGDADADGQIISYGANTDLNIVLNYILSDPGNGALAINYVLDGYFNADLNLDGMTLFAGPGTDINLPMANILLSPDNSALSLNYILKVKNEVPVVLQGVDILARDSDGDDIPDITDPDDDNDGVPDNDDYRPLDKNITVAPGYSGRVNSYEQTYVRLDNPDTNYSDKSFIHIRDLTNATYATAGLLYFDIPETLNGKRVDNITTATLTLKSDDEKDPIRVYASTANNFPDAATVTWNNTFPLFDDVLYGSVAMTPASSAGVRLTQKLDAGKVVFAVDETGDDSREKLIKDNNEIYLDFVYQEADPVVVNVVPVADTRATQSGGELKYAVTLVNAPTHDVLVPLQLSDATTAGITSGTTLRFTPQNYNVPQTVVITGKDDGSNAGTKDNKLLVYPLHSEDAAYNGVNPPDLDFNVYAVLPDANSGEAYSYPVVYSETDTRFALENAPVGMNINAKTGVITWQPDSSEVGSHDFNIVLTEAGTTVYNKAVNLTVKLVGANPTDALYVVPAGTIASPAGDPGSIGNPFTSIEEALSAASNSASKRTIYVRGGRYSDLAVNVDGINGSKDNPIILTRLPGERVNFTFSATSAFYIADTSSWLVFDGFELDGQAVNDHWDMLANHWWQPDGDSNIGGGQGFNVDGQHITIRNNVIHDAYQKGVNIYAGRYVNVHDNVVYNIGHSSLSGGHGIMRKWPRNFGADTYDSPDYQYRYDVTGNLVLGVEQRIYSRVFNKGYSNLTIDEGKPILFDETDDTDQKSRISHNLVLYGGVDHIRLKQNANMEVYNNSILPDLNRTDVTPDGITDKNKLPNLKFYGNLIASKGIAIDLDDSFTDTNGADEDPTASRKYANYVAAGGTVTKGPLAGITDLGGTDASALFADAANNDFHSVVTGNTVPVGVSDEKLQHIFALVNDYGITVKPSGWQHDHLKNAETIIGNVPDTVFDTSTYYIGPSSIEEGHQAVYLKFIDTDGKWLYTKREVDGVSWNALLNPDLTNASIYDLPNVDIQKCDACTGAYTYQLLLPHEWFDHYGNNTNTPFTVTSNAGKTLNFVYLDPLNNAEHRNILDYAVEGKVTSYELPQTETTVLNLAKEFGVASQGGTYGSYTADLAIDDDTGSFNHTSCNTTDNWWQVKLPPVSVSRMVVTGRNSNTSRFAGAEVYLMSAPYTGTLNASDKVFTLAGTAAAQEIVLPTANSATYLVIKASGSNCLHMQNVEVYGAVASTPQFVQSSYQWLMPADTAANTVVGTVSAADYQLEMITYGIVGNVPFSVDALGNIAASEALQAGTLYSFEVSASDGVHSSRIMVKVQTSATDALPEALRTGDAAAITASELLVAMQDELASAQSTCEATLNSIYPNGLKLKPDVNIGMLQVLKDNVPGWVPLIVADNGGDARVYAYLKQLPNGTRVVASGIPLFSPDSMKSNFNDGIDKAEILNILKWLAGDKGKASGGGFKTDADFLNTALNISYHGGGADWGYGGWNGLFKLPQWTGDNFSPTATVSFAASGLPENWNNAKINNSWDAVDLTKLADSSQDIFMLGEATDAAIDTVLAHATSGSPKGLYVQYSPPAYNPPVNSRLGISKNGSWGSDDQLPYGDVASIAAQCKTGTTQTLTEMAQSLETGMPDFNYEASDCPSNVGTVSCDLTKVTDVSGNSVAKLFNDGASAIRNRLLNWDYAGTDVFSLDAEYDFFKMAVLLGDKYRENIRYPMDKIATDDTTFYQALFADFSVHYARSGNPYQPDMGDFTDAQVALNAAATNTATRSFTPTVFGEWTSTGLYAPPGKLITVRRTDTGDSEVKFRFNYLRESTRLWNENKYSRPRYMSSPVVTLEKGKTYTFSTPYGGPIYLGWMGVESGATPFTVEITNVLDNPLLQAFDSASIQQFLGDVETTASDWVDIKTPYAEIHSLKSYVLKTFDRQDGTEGNGYTLQDVQDYIADLNNYLIAGNYEYAGFSGEGLSGLNAEVTTFCDTSGFSSINYAGSVRNLCTDAVIHARPKIQHVNADVNALCGALCAGNPFDSYAPVDPLGWGENHEMGHNLQRNRLKIYGGRSSEVSNNIFPLHTQWRWTVDQGLSRHPTQSSPKNQEAFTILQAAIAAGTSADFGHPLWSGTGTYDNAFERLAFFMQLAYTQQSWDMYTKMYLMERIYTDAIKTDAKWEEAKNLLGFGSYPRKDSDNVNGNDATTLSGNDFMYIAASKIAGVNYSNYFAAWGIEVSQMAQAQVSALGITQQVPLLFYYVDRELPAVMPTMSDTIPLDGAMVWADPTP